MFLLRYTIPGPGDWSIYPSGAVRLEGTQRVLVEQCNFASSSGNAVFFYGYNRNNTGGVGVMVGDGEAGRGAHSASSSLVRWWG